MRHRENQGDWAQQVPSTRWHGPYRDYGWESQQSALPEFRDPNIDFMPYEEQELEPWQEYYPRRIVHPNDVRGRNQAGPHVGKGPRGYVRSDERIYEEVCDRLTLHGQLDASDVNVEVKEGEVTLTGTVQNRSAKRLAEDISDSVSGVRDVHNRLQLRSRQNVPQRWVDEVGGSGVYPASAGDQAPPDAKAQGEASWGQGERGAAGYYDHGESELHLERPDKKKS